MVAFAAYKWLSSCQCETRATAAPQQRESADDVFTKAFPSGKEQPIETVRRFFLARKGVDPVHLAFWLYVADQNSDGAISRDEFARVWRVAAYNNMYDSWADDLRLMAFRVMDTDHDGIVDADELTAGLTKLLSLLGRRERVEDIVSKLLPRSGDCLSDDEWVRSEIASRIINRETVKPLLL